MRDIIILALIILTMVVGCNYIPTDHTTSDGKLLEIIEYDSCEYIKCYTYGLNSYVYTHKGNCRFCKERRQKELEELVEQLKGD